MRKLLEIAFVGTNYCGWQVQKDKPTVQKTLQEAIERITRCPVTLTGCSRTDAGVHARQFFVLVEGENLKRLGLNYRMPVAINTYLPKDIAVLSARDVPDGFHPRYIAHEKTYEYTICNALARDPFSADTAYFFPRTLSVDFMNEAAKAFVGRHDFKAFCASGAKVLENGDTIRTVSLCEVVKDGNFIRIRVRADGFLYNMARTIAGTLLEAGCGFIHSDDVSRILESGERKFAGQTLPACGLSLVSVDYPIFH